MQRTTGLLAGKDEREPLARLPIPDLQTCEPTRLILSLR